MYSIDFTSDRSASLVPFLSDQCYSGYGTTASTNISQINIVGGTRKISNRREQIQAQYSGDSGQAIWFY